MKYGYGDTVLSLLRSRSGLRYSAGPGFLTVANTQIAVWLRAAGMSSGHGSTEGDTIPGDTLRSSRSSSAYATTASAETRLHGPGRLR